MIKIRTRDEIELIRESGRLVAGALDLASELVGPGVETGVLDREIEGYIRGNGATPEFKGYQGYPATICASVNEEVVHGIPGSRVLRNGDIVGIDVGVRKNGYVADGARTFAIGGITESTERLVGVTREALNTAISIVREGIHLSDISHAIQRMAEDAGVQIRNTVIGSPDGSIGGGLTDPANRDEWLVARPTARYGTAARGGLRFLAGSGSEAAVPRKPGALQLALVLALGHG